MRDGRVAMERSPRVDQHVTSLRRAGTLARRALRSVRRWQAQHPRAWRSLGSFGLACAVLLWLVAPLAAVNAAPVGMPANASCATLAGADRTATNSAQWGATLLRGHGAPGGWFGVDVCGNGINQARPGGANLSCDRVPVNLAKTGCAPGHATYDGFGLSFQCVELITRFSAWAFGDAPWNWHGNAPDLWSAGHHPTDFMVIPNGSSRKPMPGDVLVWGAMDAHGNPWPAGPHGAHDGHVAVVASVHGNQLTTAEENVLWGQNNHPSDTMALIEQNGRWYVGSAQTPAYRWPSVQGATRALYGWLHSTKNTGVFNGSGAVRGAPVSPTPHPATSTSPAGDTSGGVPSLAAGVVVTDGGTLADLVWSDNIPGDDIGPRASARSLGAPPGARLAARQTPAALTKASGERDVFVLGGDGQLYEARTLPQQTGVDWRGLGAPPGVRLTGSVAAAIIPNAIAIGVIGADGQLWWRAGPRDNLGGWATAGRPSSTPLQGAPLLAGTPGSGVPMALALGADGQLYAANWASQTADGAAQSTGWTEWQQVLFPSRAGALIGPIVPLFELPTQHATVGTWNDAAVDVVVSDSAGQLWWMRRAAGRPVWAPQILSSATPVKRVLGGVVVPTATASGGTTGTAGSTGSASSVSVHLYAEGTQGAEMARLLLDPSGRPLQATWTTIKPPATAKPGIAVGAVTTDLGAVLPLDSDLSALMVATGQQVMLAGEQRAQALLASGMASAASTTTPAATSPSGGATVASTNANMWAVGIISTGDTFGDALSGPALDPRWTPLAPTAGTSATLSGALALPPAHAPNRTLLAQVAPASGTATVHVVVPLGASTSVQAGLAYLLDAGDQLELAVARSGVVSFCVVSGGQSAPCATRILASKAVTSGILLRVVNSSSQFIGQVSADGFTWQTVGIWKVTSTSAAANATAATPSPTAAATATPITSGGWTHLAFTSIALFATDGQSTQAQGASAPDIDRWPVFAQFSVTG